MDLYFESKKYFDTQIQEWQYFDKYARWDWEKQRRETWIEAVDRVVNFLKKSSDNKLNNQIYEEIKKAILNFDIMPSMRLLAMAGPTADRDNTTCYNCSAVGIDDLKVFGEILYISMCGCGVGFSVEKQFTDKLPELPDTLKKNGETHYIQDSAEGWQDAIDYLFDSIFYANEIPVFDYSQLRPAGAVLKTKGGRSSGPEVLQNTIDYIINDIILNHYHPSNNTTYNVWKDDKKLNTLDCHDIVTKLGDAAVQGGVRRTAQISLFDSNDYDMLRCKSSYYITDNEHRYNANNSMVLTENDNLSLLRAMSEMFLSGNGEPGLFNRTYIKDQIPDRRDKNQVFLTNPCGEIYLRGSSENGGGQFCNLSAAVARPNDIYHDLERKVILATIVGTIQANLTYFPRLRQGWKQNCEEERLLGVDITGARDCLILNNSESFNVLQGLKDVAIKTNQEVSELLGINSSVAITCNKPSGNTSVLVNCSSGIHSRPYPYYLRNVMVDFNSPIYKVLNECNVPMTHIKDTQFIVHFPMKSPDGAITELDQTAISQLEYWKMWKTSWTEHNPSVTIKYRKEEIFDIMQWVKNNFTIVGGISFLPIKEINGYKYLPIQQITKEEYEKKVAEFPYIDWSLLQKHELEDMTKASQELACVSGSCELR